MQDSCQQKRLNGSSGELLLSAWATERGIAVSRPVVDGCSYDLIFDVGGRLYRIQVKTSMPNGDVKSVGCSLSKGDHGKKRAYDSGDYDVLAYVLPREDSVFFIPFCKLALGRRFLTVSLPLGTNKKHDRFLNAWDIFGSDWSQLPYWSGRWEREAG